MSVRITSFKQAQGQDVLLLLIVTEAITINSRTLNVNINNNLYIAPGDRMALKHAFTQTCGQWD